jgi:hypothetical protein
MSSAVKAVLGAAQRLSEEDQLALIEALSHSLRQRYRPAAPSETLAAVDEAIPVGVARTPPVVNIDLLVTNFWPDDETADDVNDFIAAQRAEDRRREG